MLFSMNIKKDNYKFDLDKKAHYSTSFGLYYFFFTYVNNIMLAVLLSILTGLLFEIYQGYSKHHSGYSHVDVLYNILGVLSALILHGVTLL
jgi:VanZ family protein